MTTPLTVNDHDRPENGRRSLNERCAREREVERVKPEAPTKPKRMATRASAQTGESKE
jgi:hypothetical protein